MTTPSAEPGLPGVPVPELTIRQLRSFAAVAEHRSFTLAAEATHISQSVLSRTIRDVEHLLRVRLFDRNTRSVTLTHAGAELRSIVEPLLADIERGTRRIMSYSAAQSGTLAIATLPSLAAVLLPDLIRGFLDQHPGVDVQIVDGAADQVLGELVAGTAELGVTTEGTISTDFAFTPLVTEQFFGVASRPHPWTARSSLTWSDFRDQVVIAARPGTSLRQITDAGFASGDVVVSQRFNASSVATIGGLVRAGVGVVALPALEIHGFGLFDLVHVPVEDYGASRTVGLARSRTRELSPVAASFVDYIARADVVVPPGTERSDGSAISPGPDSTRA